MPEIFKILFHIYIYIYINHTDDTRRKVFLFRLFANKYIQVAIHSSLFVRVNKHLNCLRE